MSETAVIAIVVSLVVVALVVAVVLTTAQVRGTFSSELAFGVAGIAIGFVGLVFYICPIPTGVKTYSSEEHDVDAIIRDVGDVTVKERKAQKGAPVLIERTYSNGSSDYTLYVDSAEDADKFESYRWENRTEEEEEQE